ncbi:MAG: phosphoglucosamine mutase [Gammaproteobacteria bacterium]|nr:phosphoglucosamine mutase [Gammaproteobacteria bacterium]
MTSAPPSSERSDSEYCNLFGTDGIRGRVGQYPVTPETCLQIAWLVGQFIKEQGGRRVLIGKDTRISGYLLESVLEAGFISAGIDVGLLGVMPTPGVAFLTRSMDADLGVAISASHNPYQDNGFKFFDHEGLKLSDSTEAQIERMMGRELETVDASELGKASRPRTARDEYISFCIESVRGRLDINGVQIVLDCAHGAMYSIAPEVFGELGAKVETIGTEPDGLNINHNCGSTHAERLRKEVVSRGAALGIAFDGDGDRVVLVDETGELLDGDHILYCLAKARQLAKSDFGGVVGTVMTNLGLEIALDELGIPFYRADVGDRNVHNKMSELGWRLGGENSGHIVCQQETTTGDGIVSALQVLLACQKNGWSLRDIVHDLKLFPQKLVNVSVVDSLKAAACSAVNRALALLAPSDLDRHRIVVRPSGTESVVRVLVEGENPGSVDRIAQHCARAISSVV